MNIAFLIYKYFPHGGLQRDFARFVRAVQARGHHCRAYVLSWEGDELDDVEIRRVPVRALRNHRRAQQYYRWVQTDLASDPVDGVVGFNKMPGLDVYFAGDPCYVDVALRERSTWYRRSARYAHFTAYERAVFSPPSQTTVLCISESEQQKYIQRFGTPAERITLLPPGISRDFCESAADEGESRQAQRSAVREALQLTDDTLTMLFVGSGFKTKGLQRVLQSVAALRAREPALELKLLVVGSDKAFQYRQIARRLGIAQYVDFLGGRDDVPALMLAADVLIHPAISEAGGAVLLEALVSGLPVIATRVCGYAHHIAQANAGIVLRDPFSQRELDSALSQCVETEFRRRCQANGLQYARQTDLYSMHQAGTDVMLAALESRLG